MPRQSCCSKTRLSPMQTALCSNKPVSSIPGCQRELLTISITQLIRLVLSAWRIGTPGGCSPIPPRGGANGLRTSGLRHCGSRGWAQSCWGALFTAQDPWRGPRGMNHNRTEQTHSPVSCQVGSSWDKWDDSRSQAKCLAAAVGSRLIHTVFSLSESH